MQDFWVSCTVHNLLSSVQEGNWCQNSGQYAWRRFNQWPFLEIARVRSPKPTQRHFLMRLSGEELPVYGIEVSEPVPSPSQLPQTARSQGAVVGNAVFQFAVNSRPKEKNCPISYLGSRINLTLGQDAVFLKENGFAYLPFRIEPLYFLGSGYAPQEDIMYLIQQDLLRCVILPVAVFLLRNHFLRRLSYRSERLQFMVLTRWRPQGNLSRGIATVMRVLIFSFSVLFTRTPLERIQKLSRNLYESFLISYPSFAGLRVYKHPNFSQSTFFRAFEYEESYQSIKQTLLHERTETLKIMAIFIGVPSVFIGGVSLALMVLKEVFSFDLAVFGCLLAAYALIGFSFVRRFLGV